MQPLQNWENKVLRGISEKLEQARAYEKENSCKADSFRPDFHVTGTIGWINDPNGFSVYKGEYHLFYQYNPYDTEWGPMHWGHLKTGDFIKWERLPAALAPDMPFDKDGCFSGSAVEGPDGKQLLMYTGVTKTFREDGKMDEFQHQCIAVGDGVNYEKVASNPVIDDSLLPEGASRSDFRDPKIWREGEEYFAIAANRSADGSGAILMFSSKDGISWSFRNTLAECEYRYGTMWECPDFFSLDGRQLLVISPMEMEAAGYEFHAGHGVIAMCGDYDRAACKFKEDWVQSVDYGIDFYAPQTLIAPDGRRIMIGWMRNWSTTGLRKDNLPIFGSMTLPRELSLKDGRLYSNPVRELEKYRTNPVRLENVPVMQAASFESVNGRTIDLTIEVKPTEGEDYAFFKLLIGKDDRHSAAVIYRPKENLVTIDRSLASKRMDVIQSRSFKVGDNNGRIKLRVIMDKESVELFVNDGEEVATFLIYNDLTASDIVFEADMEVIVSIDKYDIRVN